MTTAVLEDLLTSQSPVLDELLTGAKEASRTLSDAFDNRPSWDNWSRRGK
jgi:hypothetical protein